MIRGAALVQEICPPRHGALVCRDCGGPDWSAPAAAHATRAIGPVKADISPLLKPDILILQRQ